MPDTLAPFINKITRGDALQVLRQLPAASIDCMVTSPPYWSLRDYGVRGQLGLEETFDEYLEKLCAVFDEVKRVLKPAGTCWVNLGDTYCGVSLVRRKSPAKFTKLPPTLLRRTHSAANRVPAKCLAQIPSRFAVEMTQRGWSLRNELIWHKPNVMPQSAKDRFTVDFEKLFFFVKSRHYYFARQFEPLRDPARLLRPLTKSTGKRKRTYGDRYVSVLNPATAEASRRRMLRRGRNMRSVWTIPNRPFKGRHYAVFPAELVETPIKAGCPPGGVVLDPFVGSGTTALVARRLGRRFIGIDLNPRYIRLANRRLAEAA